MRSWPWLGIAAVASVSVFGSFLRGPAEGSAPLPFDGWFRLMQPTLLALPAAASEKVVLRTALAYTSPKSSELRSNSSQAVGWTSDGAVAVAAIDRFPRDA